MNTAVVLPPSAASFQRVAGLPLIHRTVLTLLRSGCSRIVVLAGTEAGRLRGVFGADARTAAVEVEERFEARGEERVLVLPSDCVFTAAAIRTLQAAPLNGRPLVFQTPGRDRVALCRPAMLADAEFHAVARGGVEAFWAALHARGAEAQALDAAACVRVVDPRSATAAESVLCQRLRAESAASDGPLAHWLDRRVSLRISRWLVAHTRLRPNHITIIGTCLGLTAASILGIGSYGAGLLGTLLFLCTTIIDGCDGEVARLTFTESDFGQKFDVITDNVVHVAIFIGLGVGAWRGHPDGHYAALITILLIGFALDGVVTYFFLVRRPGFARSGGEPRSWKGRARQQLLRGFEAMMNRDFAYVLILFAAANRLHWFIWATAFGTYGFALLLVLVYRWRDAA